MTATTVDPDGDPESTPTLEVKEERDMTTLLGVDIGGTGIKAAPVDIGTGRLTRWRKKVATPRPATPDSVASVVAALVGEFDGTGIGVGFPGVVRRGVIETAANLDPSWVGVDAPALLGSDSRPIVTINDADAAGLAEVRFGAGLDVPGIVVTVTLGTGIGTGVFNNGVLAPNTEYGHLIIDGVEAELLASGRARNAEGMDWRHWADHLERFLVTLEGLIWPDLFIIGGGISADFEKFCAELQTVTPVRAAVLGNDAGIVGAALGAAEALEGEDLESGAAATA